MQDVATAAAGSTSSVFPGKKVSSVKGAKRIQQRGEKNSLLLSCDDRRNFWLTEDGFEEELSLQRKQFSEHRSFLLRKIKNVFDEDELKEGGGDKWSTNEVSPGKRMFKRRKATTSSACEEKEGESAMMIRGMRKD